MPPLPSQDRYLDNSACLPLLDAREIDKAVWVNHYRALPKPARPLAQAVAGDGWLVVGREGFEPPQLSRVVYSHLSSPMPSRPTEEQ